MLFSDLDFGATFVDKLYPYNLKLSRQVNSKIMSQAYSSDVW
jgi:hypothetical protein